MDKNVRNAKTDRLHASEEKGGMPEFMKYGLIVLAVIAVIVIGLLIWFNVKGSYVATVNGEKIKTGEYNYYLEVQKQTMLQSATAANISEDTFWATPIAGEDAKEYAKKLAMSALKEMKIQYVKAKEAKVSLTKDEIASIDSYIQTSIIDTMGENRIKANKAFEAEYTFTIDDLRSVQIQNYTIQKYWTEGITEEDANVDTYYTSNPEWYKEDSQMRAGLEEAVWARHILIMVAETATQEEKDAAKKKAEDLIVKLKAGEDFATLANANSEDTGSNTRGGDYVFGKGRMHVEFEEAAFALNPGQITETPVLTESGYHILKLEEKYAKDEPVSLKCAKEYYYEYGTDFVRYKLITAKVAEWVKDAVYKENSVAYNSIKF